MALPVAVTGLLVKAGVELGKDAFAKYAAIEIAKQGTARIAAVAGAASGILTGPIGWGLSAVMLAHTAHKIYKNKK